MKRNLLLLLFLQVMAFTAFAEIKWYNPMEAGFAVIQNQGWTDEERENPYDRFPLRVKQDVRKSIWSLSRHNAGECIVFTTNAKEITVRYTVSGNKAMSHMPATGVSGVDLYTKTRNGEELWAGASFTMGDTVKYVFGKNDDSLEFDYNTSHPHTYTLYLPLYNSVQWMEIGVDEDNVFRFERLREELPIVVYGSSIVQGACASRPGMAWTNILHRRLGRPIYNIGFSGNAFLEKEVMAMLGEIDAKAYVIDALPNSYSIAPMETLKDTIVKAVKQLRTLRPNTPVLLVDHYGYPHAGTAKCWKEREKYANEALKMAYDQLIQDGITDLYRLTHAEIAMPQDATVEGIHPSDYGMVVYADAYFKKIIEIIDEPIGECKTLIPVEQSRDFYNWMERHDQIIKDGRKAKHFKRVIIGNSIIQHWGGLDGFAIQRGDKVWKKQLKGSFNMGCGWDRIENVLWRMYHDELDGFTADNIYLMIGTNNIGNTKEEDILTGIEHLISVVRLRRPEAKLTVIGIFPRANCEAVVKRLNVGIANIARKKGVVFRDPGKAMLLDNGKIDASLFVDGLHPNDAGYAKVVDGFLE